MATKIQQARLECGFTQQQAATLLGMSRANYNYFEKSANFIYVKRLLLISEIFNKKVEDLI